MSGCNPRVTIGMPVYNGETHLPAAIEGLLSQSFGDFTLLISDNASEDATRDICLDHARRDGRIRYVRQPENRGVIRNVNFLVEQATTSLFMWHAHDDIALPDYLKACVEALDGSPDAVLAFTVATAIDDRGRPVQRPVRPLELGGPDVVRRFGALLDPIPYSENVIYGLMRRDVLLRTQRHGDFAGGDRALCAEMALYGPFVRIDRLLFHRRIGIERTPEELERYNTGRPLRLVMREWSILKQNWSSVGRAPLEGGARRRLFRLLLRRLLAERGLYWAELRGAARSLLASPLGA